MVASLKFQETAARIFVEEVGKTKALRLVRRLMESPAPQNKSVRQTLLGIGEEIKRIR